MRLIMPISLLAVSCGLTDHFKAQSAALKMLRESNRPRVQQDETLLSPHHVFHGVETEVWEGNFSIKKEMCV